MGNSLERLHNCLIEHDLKLTEQRKIIYEFFLSTTGHLTAQELYEIIKEHSPDIGLATVRRTLNIFVKCKIAKSIKYGTNETLFEKNDGEHYHLRCLNCGNLIEVKSYRMIKLIKEISRDNNFKFLSSSLIISGLCQNCKKESED